MISSHPNSLKQLLDQQQLQNLQLNMNNDYNPQIFMSQQQQDQQLTPIIQAQGGKRKQQQNMNLNVMSQQNLQFSNNFNQQQQQLQTLLQGSTDQQLNKYSEGIRPIDSLQSFQLGLNNLMGNNNTGLLGQSREDLSIFKTQDNNNTRGGIVNTDQQLMRIDNNNNPLQLLGAADYRSQSSINLLHNNNNQLRSRSGSIETHNNQQQKQKSNKKKKSNKKHKPTAADGSTKKDIQPVQLNLISPTKAQKQLNDNIQQTRQNSGSKSRKSAAAGGLLQQNIVQRKGSAGYKRNNVQQQQQPLNQMNTIGSTLGLQQHQYPNQQVFVTTKTSKQGSQIPLNTNIRPKSAALQPNAQMLEMIQQKKQQQQQQQQHIDQFNLVKQFTQAVVMVQKNLRRYLAKKQVKIMKAEQSQIERDLQQIQQKYWSTSSNNNNNLAPLRSSADSQKLSQPLKQLLTNNNDQKEIGMNLQYNNNINILDEESKGDGGRLNSNSIHSQKSIESSSTTNNRSKLSRSEANLKSVIAKEQERIKKQQQQQQSNTRPGSSEVNKVPRIGSAGVTQQQQQQKGIQVLESQVNNNKFQDRRNSQQSQKESVKNGNQQQLAQDQQIKQQQKPSQIQNMILEQDIPRITRNLNDQFDSMASINKLSEELNFKDKQPSGAHHDSFLKSLVMNESYQQQHKAQQQPSQSTQYHKKLPQSQQLNQQQPNSNTNKNNQHQSNIEAFGSHIYNMSHAIHSNSQILNSDERDVSWQFDRKSFQDFFDNNTNGGNNNINNKSHILQEESKRQSMEALGASATKAQIPNILNQYESYINEMTKKAELGKQELNKYKDRMYLSPSSQKKKSQLEKWVQKQEQKIQQKRNFMNENMNDLISKMQQDIDLTKRKINMGSAPGIAQGGSARKDSNTSLLRFNVSHDISQIDMSLGHITNNSSINATPRIIGGSGNGPVIITNNSNNQSSTFKKQHHDQQQEVLSQSSSINNNKSQSQQQQQPNNNNRKLFDYKLAQQSNNSRTAVVAGQQQQQQQQYSVNSVLDNSEEINTPLSQSQQQQQLQQQFQFVKSKTPQVSNVNEPINLSSANNSSKRSIKTDQSQSQSQQKQQKEQQQIPQILDTDDIKIDFKSDKEQKQQQQLQELWQKHQQVNKNNSNSYIINQSHDDSLNDRSNIFNRQQSDNNIEDKPIDKETAAAAADNKSQSNINKNINSVAVPEIITSSNAADSDPYAVDEDLEEDSHNDIYEEEDLENESLSKMEPPVFQSPTMSAISPSQQLKECFSEEEEKNAPSFVAQNDNKGLDAKPFQINKYENEDDRLISSGSKPGNNVTGLNQRLAGAVVVDQVQFSGPDSEREYSNAFLALKEPEHPLTIDKLQKLKEEKEEREVQTEILTDYILALLVEQMKYNMFPKRAVIMKSPSKGSSDDQSYLNNDNSQSINNGHDGTGAHIIVDEDLKQGEDISEEQSLLSSIRSISETERAQSPSASQTQQINPLAVVVPPKKKKVRGIKTTMRIVDQYIAQVFKKVKDSEDEFVENLSTPLNKDPLEILLHLQNIVLDGEMENAVAFQQSVLPVDLYLDLERNKNDVQIQDLSDSEDGENTLMNKSMMGEWENIHNKVIFDGINEALDNFRPYGLRGPPMPWSQQTRTLTYKNGQQIDTVLKSVRLKVMEWARTFSGALPCSELLMEYGIKGPLDEDKLNLLREERLALVLAAEIEENEMLWTDYEYEETQTKLDVADMILEFLAEEVARDLTKIQESRTGINSTVNSTAMLLQLGSGVNASTDLQNTNDNKVNANNE